MPFNIYPAVDENNKFPPVIRQAMVLYTEMIAAFSGKYLEQTVANHNANVTNPHEVTKAQVGLGSADNTSDITKPISTATQNALNLKAPLASPTFTGTVSGVTKSMVGLGNADNTADLTKPISTATQTALDLKAPKADPTFTGTVSGVTKTHVGLGNADNTSDVNKPVSTAQAALFIPRWKANTAYASGQQVISPSNNVVSALAAFTSGATYDPTKWSTPTDIGSAAKGLLLKNEVGTSTGAIADAIVNNIATFTFIAGRKYRIVWDSSYMQSSTADLFYWSINQAPVADAAASLSNLTPMGGRTKGITAGANMTQHTGAITAYFEPTTNVTTQIKFHTQRVVGAGTVVVIGQANETANYLIYDDGAQF